MTIPLKVMNSRGLVNKERVRKIEREKEVLPSGALVTLSNLSWETSLAK